MSLPSTDMYSFFNEFRQQEKFSDIVVKVQERSFPCHRIILASALKYFRNIFFSTPDCNSEAYDCEKREIELKGINADDFELVLAHIYGAPVNFDENNVFRLLKLSHYLCLPNLEDMCVKYVADNADKIRLHNAVCIFVFASNIGLGVLVERLTKRIATKFSSVSKYRVFERISAASLSSILAHPDFDDANPTAALDFVAEWMKFQSEEGKNMVPALLSSIRLDKVPKEWFVKALTLMTKQPTSSNVSECEYTESESMSDVEGRSPLDSPIIFDDEVDAGTVVGKFPTDIEKMEKAHVNEVQAHDETSSTRMKVPFLMYTLDAVEGRPAHEPVNLYEFTSPTSVSLLQTTNLDDVYENSSVCKSLFVDNVQYLMNFYLPPTSSSLHISCRPYVSHEFTQFNHFSRKSYVPSIGAIDVPGVATIGSTIYVYNNGTFHLFDCATSKWSEMASIESNNCVLTISPSLSSRENSLFLIGGESISQAPPPSSDPESNGKLFQQYDIREGKWTQLPQMMCARSHSASCLDDDALYVSGGADLAYQKPSIERFDFKAGKWEKIASMPRPKMNHTFFAYKNQLWFFGGKKYYSNHRTADRSVSWHHDTCGDLTWYSYDLKDAAWSDVSLMRTGDDNFYTKKIVDVILPV